MSTDIQTHQPPKPSTVRDLICGDKFKAAMAAVLPKHLTADRMARVAIAAMTRTPKLAECDPTSLMQCMMSLSQLGLEPDGRRAHLIPYGKVCTLIIDYKGLVELASRSGAVSNIHADVVCENDVFEYDRGALTKHLIDFRKPRGAVFATYAIARFKDGGEKCEVMTRDEVESIRKRSKAGTSGPWVTDWNEMAKKTVFRRLSKWLPLSPEFRDALEIDDQHEKPVVTIDTPAISAPALFEMPTNTTTETAEVCDNAGEAR